MPARARALAVALLAFASRCAFADILPGEWDIATTVTVAGQPGAIGPMHQTQCLNSAQAGNPAALLGPMASAAAGCALSDKRDDGSRLSFRLTCNAPFSAEGSGTLSYGPERVDGELRLRSTIGGQEFDTRSQVAAHRTGACQ